MSRKATQQSAILGVLIEHTTKGLHPEAVEPLLNAIMKEITDGPSSWAFLPERSQMEKRDMGPGITQRLDSAIFKENPNEIQRIRMHPIAINRLRHEGGHLGYECRISQNRESYKGIPIVIYPTIDCEFQVENKVDEPHKAG